MVVDSLCCVLKISMTALPIVLKFGTYYGTRVESMPANFQDEGTQNEARARAIIVTTWLS